MPAGARVPICRPGDDAAYSAPGPKACRFYPPTQSARFLLGEYRGAWASWWPIPSLGRYLGQWGVRRQPGPVAQKIILPWSRGPRSLRGSQRRMLARDSFEGRAKSVLGPGGGVPLGIGRAYRLIGGRVDGGVHRNRVLVGPPRDQYARAAPGAGGACADSDQWATLAPPGLSLSGRICEINRRPKLGLLGPCLGH